MELSLGIFHHPFHKTIEQDRSIPGTGSGLGVELDSKAVQVRIVHPFAAAVVGVPEGFTADALQGIRHNRVAVILGGDIGPPGKHPAAVRR